MTIEQTATLAILAGVFALLVKGPWRYDVVAVLALVVAVLAGVVPAADAFAGFAHPATVTVAAVLILSRGLSNSGAIAFVAARLMPEFKNPSLHIGTMSGLGAALSALMNNVGALALLMPVTLEAASRMKRAAALLLMPLSFATILGGMLTLIGTPPNIIIATYRGEVMGTPFAMFDFTPVGGIVAVSGILFIAFVGWHLIPKSRRARVSPDELFDIEDYVAEARVGKESSVIGKRVRDLDRDVEEHDIVIVGLIRGNRRLPGAARREIIRADDIFILEGSPASIDSFCGAFNLRLVGTEDSARTLLRSEDVALIEAIVAPGSRLEGQLARDARLRSRHGINLLAVSRQGKPFRDRLSSFRFEAGDVLLLQGDSERLPETVSSLGCLPLIPRGLRIGKPRQAGLAVSIFAAAIAAATFGLVSLPVAFVVAVVAMVVTNIVPAHEIYDSVDWPVVVLLGAMIPIGTAFEATGTTDLVAGLIAGAASGFSPLVVLAVILIVTMTLSDVMNNAATAVVMAPVAVSTAQQLGANPDAFLMAVAVGASCAFLTPIGHQNNTLIMGPGGYEFGDYWRMGLPLEALIVLVSVPAIALVWPL